MTTLDSLGFQRRTLDELTIEDDRSFRHIELYGDLKELLRREGYSFRILPEGGNASWDRFKRPSDGQGRRRRIGEVETCHVSAPPAPSARVPAIRVKPDATSPEPATPGRVGHSALGDRGAQDNFSSGR